MADLWLALRVLLWTTHPAVVLYVGVALGGLLSYVTRHAMESWRAR